MKATCTASSQSLKRATLMGLALLTNLTVSAGPPSNDHFADRAVLTGTQIVVHGSTAGATTESGEVESLHSTVWWSWTAPTDGLAHILIRSSFNADTACLVFTGSELSQLTLVTNSSQFEGVGEVLFAVAAGIPYQVVVGSLDPWASADFELALVAGPRPRNDDFTNRIHLGTANVRVAGSNRVATVEADELLTPGSGTVWWSWTAPGSGRVAVTLEETPTEPAFYFSIYAGGFVTVFTGDEPRRLRRTPSTTDLYRAIPAAVQESFDAVAGTTYHLRVGGYLGLAGLFTLNVAQTQPPSAILTAPTNRQSFLADEPIRLATQAFDPDGVVAKVDFYLGFGHFLEGGVSSRLGSPFASTMTKPFAVHTNLPPGSYDVTAIATDNYGAKGNSLSVSFWVRPTNDDFARRIAVAGSSLTVTGSSAFATREVGESLPDGGTVWWSWTPPAGGPYTITASGRALFVGVYAGSELASLTLVAEGRPQPQDDYDSAQAVFTATAETEYAIALIGGDQLTIAPGTPPMVSVVHPADNASFFLGETLTLRADASDADGSVRRVDFYTEYGLIGSATHPPYELTLTLTNPFAYSLWAGATDDHGVRSYSDEIRFFVGDPPPANDRFANRALLTGASLTITGAMVGATREVGEPTQGGGSVWWEWTAAASGVYTITARGDGFSPFLGVYEGSVLSNLTTVATDWFGGNGAPGARVVIDANAGRTYALAVAGGGDTAILSIIPSAPPSVRMTSPAPNASFLLGDTVDLHAEASDPDGDINTVDFFVNYDLIGSVTNPPYTVRFTPTGVGVTYRVWVIATDNHGISTRSEETEFSVRPPPPSNDNFADRFIVPGASLTVTGSLIGVTRELGEPAPGGFAWWSWTAPTSGVYTITAATPGYYPFLGVYTGSTVSNLVLVASDRFLGLDQTYAARVVINAVVGTSYAVAVASGGDVTLTVAATAPPTVTIVNPTQGAEFTQGDTIPLAAAANDDGRIERVDFYVDYDLVGSVTNPPFVLAFTLPYAHVAHRLWAGATDDAGTTTLSDEVRFTVLIPPPPNDAFAQRGVLTGAIVTTISPVDGATLEPGEPGLPEPRWGSVWWTWTAPMSGLAVIRLDPVFGGASLEVSTGSVLNSLEFVARSTGMDGTSETRFPAMAGTAYQLRFVSPARYEPVQLALLLDGVELSDLHQTVDGPFSARLRDSLERLWRIEASTNLQSWIPLRTTPSANGWLEWTDLDAAQFPRRFYRFQPEP